MSASPSPTLTRHQLLELVATLGRRLDEVSADPGRALDERETIALVRCWNTIEIDGLRDDPVLGAFADRVFRGPLETAATQLGATLTKGMAWHVPRLDLFIGGAPHPNSRYAIEDPSG